jgi:hypothetical protein
MIKTAICTLDFGFWILDFGFWILDFGFWILDFGFWILDFGFWILDYNISTQQVRIAINNTTESDDQDNKYLTANVSRTLCRDPAIKEKMAAEALALYPVAHAFGNS